MTSALSKCGRTGGIRKPLLLILGGFFFLLIIILLFNTFRFTGQPVVVYPVKDIKVDGAATAERLATAVRFKTISHQDSTEHDKGAYLALHAYLEQAFPRVHATLSKELVSELSLLFTWQGVRPELKPVVLMAHQDVVPVDPKSADAWSYPPFGGEVRDGYVWGRGTLDMKSGLLGILEAAEMLIDEGFQPERTVYFVFGHDEETGGDCGARQVARLLFEAGVAPAFVLDEGGLIVQDVIPGVAGPVALIGIAEKGYLSLELSVESPGGHSSRPPRQTAIGILSRSIVALEENSLPARFDGATAQLFQAVGPSMPLMERIVFANLWLFRPLVIRMLSADQKTDATIRTTTAATMIEGGAKENVLPTRAAAVVNFRLLPGDRVEDVIDHVDQTIDDSRVQVTVLKLQGKPRGASPVSPTNTAGYRVLTRSIREGSQEEDLIVAPYLTTGGTDSKHLAELSENVYRFTGVKLGSGDLDRLHGINERISIKEYARLIRIYYHLLRNLNELAIETGAQSYAF